MTTVRDTIVGALTTTVILVVFWLFCRSVLPRLPRIVFRGRLRIRRVGLRGVRGLEWSSKGFVSTRTKRKADSREHEEVLNAGEESKESLQSQHHPDSFVLRISHIYLQFHRRDPRHRSWATLHIQGVGIRLPRPPLVQAEQQSSAERRAAQHKKRTSSGAGARQGDLAEREEKRLQRLMLSPPSSPALQNRSTLHQRKSSLFEAVTGSLGSNRASPTAPDVPPASPNPGSSTQADAHQRRPQLPRRPFSSLIPNTSASSFRTIPLYVGWLIYAYIRDAAVPMIQSWLLRGTRVGLFLLASAIPVVTSLFDVEIHRLEVYMQEAETVFRVGRMGARYSMKVVSAGHADHRGRAQSSPPSTANGQNPPSDSASHKTDVPIQAGGWSSNNRPTGNNQSAAQSLHGPVVTRPSRIPWVQNSITEMLAAMPKRIGSGAKGATAFVMAGVPAAKGNLKLTFESVQVFEALFVTEEPVSTSEAGMLRQGSRSAKKTDSFFHIPSTGLHPSLDGLGHPHSPARSPLGLSRREDQPRARRQRANHDQSTDGSDSEGHEEYGTPSRVTQQPTFTAPDRHRAHGHQRSGSSDAAMGSSLFIRSPLPTSNSGDGGLYSPYQTTTARWFEAKNSNVVPQLPLAELLASPLSGTFPTSSSMQSLDSDGSDLPHGPSARIRSFNAATPTLMHRMSPAKRNIRTESDFPWSTGERGGTTAPSAANDVGFANNLLSPPSMSREGSVANSTANLGGQTLKRSSSTSQLQTMNTLTLSGFTDRWADWALEPIADSTFSSDSGWATSAQGYFGAPGSPARTLRKKIPASAQLMSLPGLSTFRVNFVLGPSMQIKQREAVHVGVELAETNIGIEAVMKVTALVKKRQQEARAFARSSQEDPGSPVPDKASGAAAEEQCDPLTVHNKGSSAVTKGTKARTALAQLGSLSVELLQIRMSHTLRPPQLVDAFEGGRADFRARTNGARTASAPSDIQLEAILRDFHFELRTSDPADPEHQKWLGTCGISDHRRPTGNAAVDVHSKRSSSLGSSFRQSSGLAGSEQHFTPPMDGGKFEAQPLSPHVAGKPLSDEDSVGHSSSAQPKKNLFIPARRNKSIRGGQKTKPPKLVEHRRAFQIDARFATFELRCATDTDTGRQSHSANGQQSGACRLPEMAEVTSDLVNMRKFSMKIRSSWTPFGLLPSLKAITSATTHRQTDESASGGDFSDPSLNAETVIPGSSTTSDAQLILPRPNCPFSFFATDPNEQAVIAEFDLRSVSSHVKLGHASALVAFAASLQAAKGSGPQPASTGKQISLPRLSLAFSARDMSFRLDASENAEVVTQPTAPECGAHRSLVVAAPSVEFVFHGSYKDAYARRSADGRKDAWKSFLQGHTRFRPDDNEWKQRATTTKTLSIGPSRSKSSAHAQSSTSRSKPTPGGIGTVGSISEEVTSKLDNSVQGDKPPHEGVRTSSPEPTLAPEYTSGQSSPAQGGPLGGRTKVAYSGSSGHLYNYAIDSNCQITSVEAYFGFRKERISKSRLSLTVPSGSDLPPFGMSHQHILSLHQITLGVLSMVPAGAVADLGNYILPSLLVDRAATEVQTDVRDVAFDMWHPQALGISRDLIQTFADAEWTPRPGIPLESNQNTHKTSRPNKSLLDKLPGGIFLFSHMQSVTLNLGGPDKRCEADLARGISVKTKAITIEYAASKDGRFKGHQYGARSAISLPEDIRVNANALAAHGPAAAARMTAIGFEIIPLLDADQAIHTQGHVQSSLHAQSHNDIRVDSVSGHSQEHSHQPGDSKAPTLFAPAVWDFQKTKQRLLSRRPWMEPPKQQDADNYLIRTSSFNLSATCYRAGKRHTDPENLKIDCANMGKMLIKVEMLHTYCLLLALSSLLSLKPRQPTQDEGRPGETPAEPSPAQPSRRPNLAVAFAYELPKVDVFFALAKDTHIFVHVHRLQINFKSKTGLELLWDTLIAAVESARVPVTDLWEEALRLRKWRVLLSPPSNNGPASVDVSGLSASIRIPTDYQFHHVIEHSTVAFKATKQLAHQFLHDSSDTVIYPIEEDPKRVPNISFQLQLLTFEAEDDPIETRLNLIWRAGSSEQPKRMEREATFEEAAAEIRSAERGKSALSLAPSIAANTSSLDSTDAGSVKGANASVTIEEARRRLDMFNGQEWIRRQNNAKREQGRREEQTRDQIFGSKSAHSFKLPVRMAEPSLSAPLLRSIMTRIRIDISRPSFPFEELPDFLHLHGGGMPKDTKYSTVIPMQLRLRLGEWRISLRDYPLPLLHVPPVHPDKGDAYAWDMSGDICLAEQLGGPESIRKVPAVVVPASTGRKNAVPYSIQVPKMVMPLKFYGSPTIDVKTPFPTRIVWGQSVQPAIHDVQRVIESITSPPHDPSPRLPFWDKIPLLLHGHARATFSGDGDVHFFFKGSRDPYEVTGHGAGWVMCWRKGVELRIGFENDDREFFQVISSECLLAIPDLQDYLDLAASGHGPNEPVDDADANDSDNYPTVTGSQKRYMVQPRFQKVCLRLSNGVRFGVGLIYERTCTDDSCKKRPRCRGSPFYRECRMWDRVPHWKVSTKSKQHVEQAPESLRSDSFEGWRSHHIHPSLSIFSPKEGIAGYGTVRKSEEATNSLYFSPLAWEHFWRWIALFGGALSLPVRQGKLFPNTPPQSAKLGAFIATIKYRFMIEPIFISHFYQQASKVNLAKGRTTLVGVKARVDSFRADLHQRQEETIKERPEMKNDTDKKLKVFHKPFNEVEVDCAGIDLRTVWARFYDESRQLVDEFEGDAEDDLDDFPDTNAAAGEEEWYDIADFAEIDWQPPNGATPDLSITQTMVCPRFHYYRKVESKRERRARQASIDPHFGSYQETHDEEDSFPVDTGLTPISELAFSKFGNEHTHTCLVGTSPSSPMVQSQLAEHRLSHLLAELQTVTKARQAAMSAPDTSAAASMSSSFASHRGGTESPPDAFDARIADLKTKIKLIKDFIHSLGQLRKDSNGSEQATGPAGTQMFVQSSDEERLDLRALYRDWETFHNRYFVHNPIVYFSTDTRNALLKYYHCSRIRKGFAHHMTAKAVRYVRALRAESTPEPPATQGPRGPTPETLGVDGSTPGENGSFNYLKDWKGLLSETIEKMPFGPAETPRLDQQRRKGASDLSNQQPEPRRGLSDNFTINKSNVAVLLKPQVVLQAKGSIQSSVIITAKRLRLQNYSVLEDRFSEDELNARLMYRNFLAVDGLQAFAPTTHCQYLRTAPHRTMFAYVPLETLVDMGYQTRDFDRIISSTDAVAGYDKFNRLRVNASDKVIVPEQDISNPDFDHLLHHMDFIQVRCPRIALSADSNHFAAIYSVVTDLLLYRDPTSKDHSKRLEEMLFNYDFENLDALSEVLTGLQARVRHAKDLLGQYQENFQFLNKDGKADLYTLNVETLEMITDLDLLMQAITTARDHHAATDNDKKSALRLKASADELGWYMMGLQDGEQLAKLSIKNASFSWWNKADSSASNELSIGDLQALNIRPDAHYAEIISKYSQAADHDKAKKGLFLKAEWKVLAPVGGIAIIETLDLNLHPVRLSIELKVGREIMDYIFGSKRRQALQGQDARITEVGEEPAAIPANADHFPKKAKRKGLFGFLSTNKGKESATPSRLAVPSSAADDEREVARSEGHRSSPTKRQGRSRSREPREPRPAEERRRSFEDVRSKSRTRDRSRHRGEREQELGGDSDAEDAGDQDAKQQRDIARRNAESMRRRASTNRTFVNVKFAQTILCLSYKGDKDKSITDLFDVVFRAPTLEYKNQTCGYEDLVNFCKKDIIRAAWDQRVPLLKGILHRPRKTSRNMRDFAAQGIHSAVGRLTGQERVASSSRGDSMVSKSNDASSLQTISPGRNSVDEDDDENEDHGDDESVQFDSERREGAGTSDISSSFQQRDSIQDDSWSGRSAITELDSPSVYTSS